MNRIEFERRARVLLSANPVGYTDENWVIKYYDDEYWIRWSNGLLDRKHMEMVCWFKDNTFHYY
jgi:hypothetical protein